MKKLICLVLLFSLSIISCDSDAPEIIEVKGTIVDTGSIASDGCGWLIRIDAVDYSPTYLSTQYQEDGMEVQLNLEFLESNFFCGLVPTEIPQIRIEQIRPF